MNNIKNTEQWIVGNRDLFVEFLRIYLGIGLFLKGMHFIYDPQQAFEYIKAGKLEAASYLMVHAVALGHLCGGGLLAIGLLTRLAALVQVPILFGAVFYVHLQHGLFTTDQTLEFTLLVLFLLVVFSFYGGGRLSADYFIERRWRAIK